MKKTIILLAASIVAINAFAQTDTAKKIAMKQPPAKIRIIGGAQMSSANDVVKNLSKSKNHTVFVSMLAATGLNESLLSGTYTVFAPTDDAFKKLPAGTIDSLMKPTHITDLTRQVNSYIIQGKLRSADIAKQIKSNGQASITTLSGSVLTAKINSDRNLVLTDANGNQAIVSQFDIDQSNGIVDVITAPLIAKTN